MASRPSPSSWPEGLTAGTGSVTLSPNLRTAFFAQHQMDDLRPAESAVEHVRRLMPKDPEAKVRARVAQMGLVTEKMDTPAQNLSGGEKARLLMGLATFDGPNVIILDEPTNHLDIDSRAALIEALNDFSGAVILISHDRYLIEATADQLWLVHDGTVAPYEGDMEEYRALITGASRGGESKSAKPAAEAQMSKADQRRDSAQRREQLKPLARKIRDSESLMEKLGKRIQVLETVLADPALYTKDPQKAGALAKERSDLTDQLTTVEEEWLTLSADYEAAMAG